MERIWAIARRDLVAAFTAPLAWLVLAAWQFITGLSLGLAVWSVQGGSADQPLYVGSLGTGMALLILLAPALTMSSFAGERQQGTMALLLTAPVADHELVLGKLLGAAGLLVALIAALLPQIAALAAISAVAPAHLAAGLLGLLLAAVAAAGLGVWISLLVEAPVTAYVLTCGAILVLLLVGLLPRDGALGGLAQAIGLGPRLGPFLAGRIELGAVAYLLAIAIGSAAMATSVLAARRIDG